VLGAACWSAIAIAEITRSAEDGWGDMVELGCRHPPCVQGHRLSDANGERWTLVSDGKLTALSAKMKDNPNLKEQLKKATNIDQVVTILKSAGISITKAELLRSEAQRVLALSDAELESATIRNASYTTDTYMGCATWVFQCCG